MEGEPKSPNPTPNQDDFLKFDESQIDSQVCFHPIFLLGFSDAVPATLGGTR